MFGKRKKRAQPQVCAVIVAAGSSSRMGGENKLLLDLGGIPVLAHTRLAFQNCAAVTSIVLVCREQDIVPYSELACGFGVDKLSTVLRGGDSRTSSTLAGVANCPEGTELVAVHDGARPLVSDRVITLAVEAATACSGAAPVVPMKDSVKRIRDGFIEADVPRERICAAQTPQVFRRELLERALNTAAREGRIYTDDCAAVEALGAQVRATEGDYDNIKITTPEDLLLAEALLEGRDGL